MENSALNPNAAAHLLEQGIAASKLNDAQSALSMFAQASAVAPASAVPHFLSASELAGMGEYERAEVAFANAVLLAPEMSIARYQLGLLQFSSGRAALALVTWQPLLNPAGAQPADQALASFVRGYAALAQDFFELAVSHFEAGLALDNSNPALSGDVRKVIARVEALIADLNPKAPGARTAPASPADAPDTTSDETESIHVLLSNYQTPGSRH